MSELTIRHLDEYFFLDEGGVLRWRSRPMHHFLSEEAFHKVNERCAGKKAGVTGADGVEYVGLKGLSGQRHLIPVKQVTSWMRTGQVDRRWNDYVAGTREQ